MSLPRLGAPEVNYFDVKEPNDSKCIDLNWKIHALVTCNEKLNFVKIFFLQFLGKKIKYIVENDGQ